MEKKKVLFITSELNPFNNQSDIANITSDLPNFLSSNKYDVRILMPKFGYINERKHRLHEVVRLSGLNVMFNNDDFALTVKVAALPNSKTRLQVYFLFNDEFFERKNHFRDEEDKFIEDNDDRMIFFSRGVMETIKKFEWAPDIIMCNGWMTSLIPMYAKTLYAKEPVFLKSKIIYNKFNTEFTENLSDEFIHKARLDELLDTKALSSYSNSYDGLINGAIAHSDAILNYGDELNADLADTVKAKKVILADFPMTDELEDMDYSKVLELLVNFNPDQNNA